MALLVIESTAMPYAKPLVTPWKDESAPVARFAVTMVGDPQKLKKSVTGVEASFLLVFCPMPSNTGNPIEAMVGLRSMSGPNVFLVMSEVKIFQAFLLLGAVRSKARNAAWSFVWFDAPSLIDSEGASNQTNDHAAFLADRKSTR